METLIANFQVEELENRLEFKGWAQPSEVEAEVGYDNDGFSASGKATWKFD